MSLNLFATLSMTGVSALADAGDHLVATGDANFKVIDWSTPGAPTVVGTLADARFGGNQKIAVSGTVAYVTAKNQYLLVVDLSDPASPAIIGVYDDAVLLFACYGIAIRGDFVYVGAASGTGGSGNLIWFDVSDPATPAYVSQMDEGFWGFDLFYDADSDRLFGAFVSTNLSAWGFAGDETPIFDTDVASVTPSPGGLYTTYVNEQVLYVGVDSVIDAYDISPAVPILLDVFNNSISAPVGLVAVNTMEHGQVLYVTSANFNQVRALDINDPTAITTIDYYQGPTNGLNSTLAQRDGFVYATDSTHNLIRVIGAYEVFVPTIGHLTLGGLHA